MSGDNPYDQKYADEEYYWGRKPYALCDKVIGIIRPSRDYRPTLLDLGSGDGRNAVYFTLHGFDVTALDISRAGIEKTKRYAEEVGAKVEAIVADFVTCKIEKKYDVLFSTGTLHYLRPEGRGRYFRGLKKNVSPHGIHASSVLVMKPFIPRAPDAEKTAHLFRSGELLGYYWDWEVLHFTEEIFTCT